LKLSFKSIAVSYSVEKHNVDRIYRKDFFNIRESSTLIYKKTRLRHFEVY